MLVVSLGLKVHRSLVPSNASIEAALDPLKFFEGIGKNAARSAADLLSNQSAWISRAPAAAFRSERLRFRTGRVWLSGLFRPAASVPATAR